MSLNKGPTYEDWLEVLAHSKAASADELHTMIGRVEEDAQLSQRQRIILLERLGDLQIAAAQHEEMVQS